jgi:hypothetical protein
MARIPLATREQIVEKEKPACDEQLDRFATQVMPAIKRT